MNSNELHDAIEKENFEKFWRLVVSGDEELLNGQDYILKNTPAHLALCRGQIEMAFVLISHPKVNLDLLNQAKNNVEQQTSLAVLIEENTALAIIDAIRHRSRSSASGAPMPRPSFIGEYGYPYL